MSITLLKKAWYRFGMGPPQSPIDWSAVKPCFSCEGVSLKVVERNEEQGACSVKCMTCYLIGPIARAGRDGAIGLWNARIVK